MGASSTPTSRCSTTRRSGPGCELYPGVVIRERCELGARCTLHANAVIGADGFGYRPAPDGRGVIKIPQIGIVRLGNDVEIGASTCIDRAKFSATVIGDGTKIDNLCQIAHNCVVGRGCVIAGQAAIAGSVTMGDGVVIGGNASSVTTSRSATAPSIAGGAAVTEDVPAGETWAGYPAHARATAALREYAAMRRMLPTWLNCMRTPTKKAEGQFGRARVRCPGGPAPRKALALLWAKAGTTALP